MDRIFDVFLGGAICLAGMASIGIFGVFSLLGLRRGPSGKH